MKKKLINAYLKTADIFAQCSTAIRLQVGAIIVKDDRIISIGYNGTIPGASNECEHRRYVSGDIGFHPDVESLLIEYPYLDEDERRYKLVTNKDVLHAESNAITKLASSNESGKDSTMFCTHSPCIDCAKLIYQSGITTLYYTQEYKSTAGIDFLKDAEVTVRHYG